MQWPRSPVEREAENICSEPGDFSVLASHPFSDPAALPALRFYQILPPNFSLFLKNITNKFYLILFYGFVILGVGWGGET